MNEMKRTVAGLKPWRVALLVVLSNLSYTPAFASSAIVTYSPEKAPFSLRFQGEVTSYRISSAFVLPAESFVLEILDKDSANRYSVEFPLGLDQQIGPRKWQWKAPSRKGTYPIRISRRNSNDVILLNVFVMVPASEQKGEYLNGYRIGRYPVRPLRGLAVYRAPRGFIEVTRENEDTLLVPHFRLNQFLCKQEGAYPKYVVLRSRLLLKLELLLEQMNLKGHHGNTLHIMSGYRTPYYNRMIGNGAYSRHVWGGAADVFLDESPINDFMDDLNSDGKVDEQDAKVLYDLVEQIDSDSAFKPFLGGLSVYPQNDAHGPFVHMDERGYRARW